jgi:hypothetical protein
MLQPDRVRFRPFGLVTGSSGSPHRCTASGRKGERARYLSTSNVRPAARRTQLMSFQRTTSFASPSHARTTLGQVAGSMRSPASSTSMMRWTALTTRSESMRHSRCCQGKERTPSCPTIAGPGALSDSQLTGEVQIVVAIRLLPPLATPGRLAPPVVLGNRLRDPLAMRRPGTTEGLYGRRLDCICHS